VLQVRWGSFKLKKIAQRIKKRPTDFIFKSVGRFSIRGKNFCFFAHILLIRALFVAKFRKKLTASWGRFQAKGLAQSEFLQCPS